MLIRRTVLAGQTDSFPVTGRYFSLIQGSKCRINLLRQGSRIFSSEVYEGMGSKFEAIDAVEVESEVEQTVEYWMGESEYRYTPPALRAANNKMSRVGIKTGVSRVVTANPKRLRCRMTFDEDAYIGGDDMALDGENVINAIPVKAGESVSIESSGSINAFVSTREAHEFVNDSRPNIVLAPSELHLRTVAKMTELGVFYVDVDVPSHLINQNMTLEFRFGAPNLSSGGQTRYVMSAAQSDANANGNPVLIDLWGVDSSFRNLEAPYTVSGGAISHTRQLKYAKTRLWVYATMGADATLASLTLKHPDWTVIHSIVDVIEETL